MTRLIIPALVALLVAVSWPSGAEAKTTYFKCQSSYKNHSFKLEEPWFGRAKFFSMSSGKLRLLRSEVTEDFIRFWDSEGLMPDMLRYINRGTGDGVGVGKCLTIDRPPSK